MRRDSRPVLAAALLAAGILAAAAPDSGKLVRTDLLTAPPAEIATPRRDIFRPQPGFAPQGFRESVPAAPAVPPAAAASEDMTDDSGPEESAAGPAFDLNYIGYIASPHRTVALVVIEGQAQAVTEGEEVFPGVKVESVSREKIVLVGPGFQRTEVPLQGDES